MRSHASASTVLAALLVALPLPAQGVRVQAPPRDVPSFQDELGRIRKEHAHGLRELARVAAGRRLLNDAERLVVQARRWVPEAVESAAELKDLRRRRAGLEAREAREAYRRFLRSGDFEKARHELEGRRKELERSTLERLLALARESFRQSEPGIAEAAIEEAFALDPGDPKLDAIAGKERMEKLRARWREERSLARLKLGKAIVGPDITQADLKGKVVLWRSFSL